MRIEENFSLINYNTFGLDVSAAWFVEYTTEEELMRILNDEFFIEQTKLHIGKGSNLLFLDNYEGIILHSGISGIEVKEETDTDVTLRVGAGVDWDDLVAYAVEHNWWGIENLSLIPGETGSAALQNIGAYGSEVEDVIVEVEAFSTKDKQKHIFSNEACD
ncbi:MAG: FAD-binding protein, partial [Tannerellaceae bacterium]